MLGDLKFGGNAQSISKDRFVHHTSFLWNYNTDNMKYLTIPSKQPEYRLNRDHTEFLTYLEKHAKLDTLGMKGLEFDLIEHLRKTNDIVNVDVSTLTNIVASNTRRSNVWVDL